MFYKNTSCVSSPYQEQSCPDNLSMACFWLSIPKNISSGSWAFQALLPEMFRISSTALIIWTIEMAVKSELLDEIVFVAESHFLSVFETKIMIHVVCSSSPNAKHDAAITKEWSKHVKPYNSSVLLRKLLSSCALTLLAHAHVEKIKYLLLCMCLQKTWLCLTHRKQRHNV